MKSRSVNYFRIKRIDKLLGGQGATIDYGFVSIDVEGIEHHVPKNWGMLFPTKATEIKNKWDNKYNSFEEVMGAASHKYRWCEAGLCACLGCVNNWVRHHGYTKKDWEEWVAKNPDPTPPPPKGYGFKSFTYGSFNTEEN